MIARSMLALVLFLGAGAVIGGPADGIYDATGCGTEISDTRVELRDHRLIFYESTCRLGPALAVDGFEDATIHIADCQGEGQDWQTRFLMMPTRDGGLVLLRPGWGDRYARCGPSSARDELPASCDCTCLAFQHMQSLALELGEDSAKVAQYQALAECTATCAPHWQLCARP